MFYSNSNIDSAGEFEKRLDAARRLADADSVELVADGYDHDGWLREVADGFEDEPEKGARCARCFRYNLSRAAGYAAAHGFDAFATSLTVSPHKVSDMVFAASGDGRFMKADFKKRDGFKTSLRRSAELGLYRQSYCGCEFSRRA
jgi:predicted adenine nucleotide alpha hydrolase (AANH) superfamily ATPase